MKHFHFQDTLLLLFFLGAGLCLFACSQHQPQKEGLEYRSNSKAKLAGTSGPIPEHWHLRLTEERSSAHPEGFKGSEGQPFELQPKTSSAHQDNMGQKEQALYLEGLKNHGSGNFSKAIEIWKDLLEQNVENAKIWHLRARSEAQLLLAEDASASASKAFQYGKEDLSFYTEEPDFSPILNSEAWKAFLSSLQNAKE